MKYTATKYSIFAGKSCIATLLVGGTLKGDNELVILQGMNREETVKKIVKDCPEFALEYSLTEDYYPMLRSNSFFSNQKHFNCGTIYRV